MTRQTRRALIIGGSMAGLFAGLYLRRRGWETDICERSPTPLTGRGAGIMTHPEMRRALADFGIDTSRDFGVPIERRLVLDRAGAVVAERVCPQMATSWNRLFAMLTAAFGPARYHLGKDLRTLSQTGQGVAAQFADGSAAAGDLIIGADGFRSTVRALLLPGAQPAYAGYVAWRGLGDEQTLAPVLSQPIFDTLAFCLPPGEQFLGYPVAGPDNDLRPGQRRYNVVWYRPADEATELHSLLTDVHGVTHAISIPPPLIRPEHISAMRAAAERLIAPQLREIARLMAEPILQPIYDLETPRMAFGRVAILGDAAFVARPHVAAGVSKAAEDALALAAALDAEDDVAAALRRFEAARLPIGRRIIERARHLGAYLQASRTAEEEAHSGRYSTAEAVITETAVLDFLYG